VFTIVLDGVIKEISIWKGTTDKLEASTVEKLATPVALSKIG
jgi:hypothetical protein